MVIIFALLLLFLGVGLFAREYNSKTSLLLIAIIIGMLLLLYQV